MTMAYERLNLKNNDVFDETHIKHLEDGIDSKVDSTELKCSFETNSSDIWLVKYNADTTFNTITKIRAADALLGEVTVTFSTEASCLYSLAFTRSLKDADIGVNNISLKVI